MMYVIIIAALVIGIVLMNEYGWADLTGNIRNNLVFETRNKTYGAYEIRQKYSHRLLIAFFGSLGFLTLAAFTPKFFHTEKKVTVTRTTDSDGDVIQINEPMEKKEPKEKIFENKVKEPSAPKAPDVSTVNASQPKPSDTQVALDTAQKPKDAIASNVDHKSNDTSGTARNTPVLPVTGGGGNGGDGDCKDCPPPIRGVAEVTEQATFDYKKFFREHLRIPEEVYATGKSEVRVYVGFVVDEEGNVTNVSIRKGAIPALDDEVKRVAGIMPRWKPARFNEHNVKVRMSIPVKITLR